MSYIDALSKVAAVDYDELRTFWNEKRDPRLLSSRHADWLAARRLSKMRDKGWSWRTGLVDAGGAAVGGGLGYLLARNGSLFDKLLLGGLGAWAGQSLTSDYRRSKAANRIFSGQRESGLDWLISGKKDEKLEKEYADSDRGFGDKL